MIFFIIKAANCFSLCLSFSPYLYIYTYIYTTSIYHHITISIFSCFFGYKFPGNENFIIRNICKINFFVHSFIFRNTLFVYSFTLQSKKVNKQSRENIRQKKTFFPTTPSTKHHHVIVYFLFHYYNHHLSHRHNYNYYNYSNKFYCYSFFDDDDDEQRRREVRRDLPDKRGGLERRQLPLRPARHL